MTVSTETEFARSHKWDEDGDTVEGTYLRFEEGQTKAYGPKPIVILSTGNGEVGVWLFHNALLNRFRDEVAKRPGKELTIGERISITRGEKKKSENTGYTYQSFTVKFPDAPASSTSALLGLDTSPEPLAEDDVVARADPQDETIPF